MNMTDCSNRFLTVKELIKILETIDPDMAVCLRCQDTDFFDIDVCESYDGIMKKALLVLEASG